jgi:hypothetical protein
MLSGALRVIRGLRSIAAIDAVNRTVKLCLEIVLPSRAIHQAIPKRSRSHRFDLGVATPISSISSFAMEEVEACEL